MSYFNVPRAIMVRLLSLYSVVYYQNVLLLYHDCCSCFDHDHDNEHYPLLFLLIFILLIKKIISLPKKMDYV
jgi:hypothetical protein